jgi:hypothetical protein
MQIRDAVRDRSVSGRALRPGEAKPGPLSGGVRNGGGCGLPDAEQLTDLLEFDE